MKKLILFALLLISAPSYAGITYETLNIQAPYATRFGVGEKPEIQYEEVKATTKNNEVVAKTIEDKEDNLSLKDLNVKYLADEISAEMDMDSAVILADLSLLYNSAIQRSETIRYAIYKLSTPKKTNPMKAQLKKF